jgi:hypothetical protein
LLRSYTRTYNYYSGLSSLVSGNSFDEHFRRLNGSNKIHLDITFTSPIDNDLAKATLGSVANLEVINCFKSICSVSVPIDKLEEVTTIVQVHILNRAQPMSNVLNEKSFRRSIAGSVTSEGDRAIYADQARAMFAVNGSGIVIGVIGDSFNCKGGAMNDTLTGDLPMNVTILRDLNPTQCQQAGKPPFPLINVGGLTKWPLKEFHSFRLREILVAIHGKHLVSHRSKSAQLLLF